MGGDDGISLRQAKVFAAELLDYRHHFACPRDGNDEGKLPLYVYNEDGGYLRGPRRNGRIEHSRKRDGVLREPG